MTVDRTDVAESMQKQQNACMASITIRDVPEEVRGELAARAARSGQSMQEYLRAKLVYLAAHPTVDDVIARARERVNRTGGSTATTEEILEWIREGRR